MLVSELRNNKRYLPTLKRNIAGALDFCKNHGQDWVEIQGGMEGSGKSNLSLQKALLYDPEFTVEQIAWGLNDFIRLSKKYKNEPYKVILYDEAVRDMFSREYSKKNNVALVKMFISNRSYQHIYLLNIPSIFYLDRYMREWRVRVFNYCYFNQTNPKKRYFAYYDKMKYTRMIIDKNSRLFMSEVDYFLRHWQPSFQEPYKALEGELWEQYSEAKKKYQEELTREAEELIGADTSEDVPLKEFLKCIYTAFEPPEGYNEESGYLRMRRADILNILPIGEYKFEALKKECVKEGLIKTPMRAMCIITDKGREYIK